MHRFSRRDYLDVYFRAFRTTKNDLGMVQKKGKSGEYEVFNLLFVSEVVLTTKRPQTEFPHFLNGVSSGSGAVCGSRFRGVVNQF